MNAKPLIFLGRCSLFACFAVGFYICCVVIFGLVLPSSLTKNLNYRIGSYGHMHSRLRDLKTYGSVDILFLGSSHAYRGYDPRIFAAQGIRSFNLGSSSQTPIQTEMLLKRYLDHLKPEIVVYDVYPGSFASDGVESAVDLIANDRIDIETLRMALKINHIKVYNTLIYGIVRGALSLDVDFVENMINDNDTYVKGGFVETDSLNWQHGHRYTSRRWNLRESQLNAFENILKYLHTLNIDVVLVQAPISRELYQSYVNNDEIDGYFKSLSTYYNFNDLMSLSNRRYFFDSHHLNQSGVAVFNAQLIEMLER